MCVGSARLLRATKCRTPQEVTRMSPDSTQIVALRIEPTYSAREAAVLLGRSYSWLDQRVRGGQFTNPDGSVLQPLRTPRGARRLRPPTLPDIAPRCYR